MRKTQVGQVAYSGETASSPRPKRRRRVGIAGVLASVVALVGSETRAWAEEEAHEAEATSAIDKRSILDQIYSTYFAIFYGPSIGKPASLQPSPDGGLDPTRPLLFKNYLTLGYMLTDQLSLSGTAYWHWVPVHGEGFSIRDPYVQIAHHRLFGTERLNLYADFRVHFPVTHESRMSDMLASVQTFQILTYQVGETGLTLGAYGSVRATYFGKRGSGNDMELYLGPNLSYQISDTVAFTLLYEMGSSHTFGDRPFLFYNDGTDLEPGISWAITPNLTINPYLNLYVGNKVTLASTSIGMTLSWTLL